MYIYNVTIKLLPQIEQEWLAWMYQEHIPEVLATGFFIDATLFALLEPVDEDGITYTVQYKATTKEQYEQYIEQHAPALREKAYAKFGDKFIGMRSLVKALRTFNAS
jgi:hypothetical protein